MTLADLRDGACMALGVAIIAYEVFALPKPDPQAMAVALALLGFPGGLALARDGRKKQ